eukprot:TRINITY_DN61171_c0_g1_i1.p1 TRINITY_DN61171_c0_g1~~TRINITY_DN61171_c0_g1_i1.p1  ORF type:complete len:927 (-),score=147.04 TRINITY_DN61171_c0_g1_i1:102-2777(-)
MAVAPSTGGVSRCSVVCLMVSTPSATSSRWNPGRCCRHFSVAPCSSFGDSSRQRASIFNCGSCSSRATSPKSRNVSMFQRRDVHGDVHRSPEVIKKSDEVFESTSARLVHSMELLDLYSEEAHPGHEPGRFAGMGPEFAGMEFDGRLWHMKNPENGEKDWKETALATLSEMDQILVTKFVCQGGLALCLSSAFKTADKLRSEARKVLGSIDTSKVVDTNGADSFTDVRPDPEILKLGYAELAKAGLGQLAEFGEAAGTVGQAVLLMKAADLAEEREAGMRNVWSDVDFLGGEANNAELVARLEMQFASQLFACAEARIQAKEYAAADKMETSDSTHGASAHDARIADADAEAYVFDVPIIDAGASDIPSVAQPSPELDGVFEVALGGCEQMTDLARRLPASELTATLAEPRNLGVALDLIGVYLKNYEIDKADHVISRIIPLCRERGGTWLVKGLDKLCAVRMKQFRSHEALVALKEIEKEVPFSPTEGWEFHEILYRNFAWCYSSLDEAEQCLIYTRKSVEVKRACGVPASWFDIWDLGKSHARLGQKTNQCEEMRVAFSLCVKAAEIHRTAEPNDRIMLAKILSNVGEVAMGIGDSYLLAGHDQKAHSWYKQAVEPLHESHNLHVSALGPMKPLAGWAAGTLAHCMVRLGEWDKAREYLAMALVVECTKDSTTPGCVIELIDRVLNCHHQLGDLSGMSEYTDDLLRVLAGLRARGWDTRERDVFALLLQKVATCLLVADDGCGKMLVVAVETLQEAENSLLIHLSAPLTDVFSCDTCGSQFDRKDDLELHSLREHSRAFSKESIDVEAKKFGPRVDPTELLNQIRSSITILQLSAGIVDKRWDSSDRNQIDDKVNDELDVCTHTGVHDLDTRNKPAEIEGTMVVERPLR